MPRLLSLVLAAFFLLGTPVIRGAGSALISATDLFNLKQIESPALSPDGRWVVYIVRSIESKPEASSSAKAAEDRDGQSTLL